MKLWLILAVLFGIMLAVLDTMPSLSLGTYANLNDRKCASPTAPCAMHSALVADIHEYHPALIGGRAFVRSLRP